MIVFSSDLDVTSLVSGATSDLDAVLKRERRQALDVSQLDTDNPNDLLEALQESEFGSLISSIDVDALDAAIGDAIRFIKIKILIWRS